MDLIAGFIVGVGLTVIVDEWRKHRARRKVIGPAPLGRTRLGIDHHRRGGSK